MHWVRRRDKREKKFSWHCKPRQEEEKVGIRISITAGKWRTAIGDLISSFSEMLCSVSARGNFWIAFVILTSFTWVLFCFKSCAHSSLFSLSIKFPYQTFIKIEAYTFLLLSRLFCEIELYSFNGERGWRILLNLWESCNSTIISKNTEDCCVLYLDSPISSMSGN